MTWEYEYDEESDETTIYWDGDKQATINGSISRWRDGYPVTPEARDAIRDILQTTDHPRTIVMQYDMNFGFTERTSEQS